RRPGSQEKKTWRRGEKKPGRNNQPPLTRRERDFGMSRFLRAVHCKYTPVAGACGRAENGSTGLFDVSNYPADSSSTKKRLRHGHAHVRFGSKADMCAAKRHVRFTPKIGLYQNRTLRDVIGISPKGQEP